MSIPLPSKRIKALIIIVAALFVAYFLYVSNVKSWVVSFFAKNAKPAASLDLALQDDESSSIDTDNDGLKDWQEVLWGTDSKKADTDGDGTNDGAEVAAGRDPAIAGPKDNLTDTRGIASSSLATFAATVSDDPNNLSTSLSKDFFAKFMALQNNGQLTDQSQQELINNAITDIDPGSIPPRYTTADIKNVPTNKDSLKAYGNSLAKLVTDFQDKIKAQRDNVQALNSYDDLISDIKDLPVPTVLAFNHLQLLNNFNISHTTLSYLIDYKDPLKGLSALKTLQSNNNNAIDLYINIASAMQKNAIIFNKSEPGSIWNNYL